MLIQEHSKDARFVLFTPETTNEIRFLETFPGLLKSDFIFYCPNKINIVYNLYSRLSDLLPSVRLSPELEKKIYSPVLIPQIDDSFKFHTDPLPFQRIALRYLIFYNGGGLLLEPGMGKTKIVLDFIAYKGFKKACIVCPKPLLEVWKNEAEKHRPELKTYVIKSTDWEKEVEGVSEATLVVTNYNKAVAFCENREFSSIPWDFLGVDEALIKTHDSQRTKALTALGRKIPAKCLMSGTLINNSTLDAYGPLKFLEPSLVGNSHWNFANCFSHTFVLGKGEDARRVRKGSKDQHIVREMLKSVSIVMTKDEWLNLPPKKFINHIVQLNDDAREVYGEFARNWYYDLPEGSLEATIPLTRLAKLIQISNGFAYIDEYDDIDSLCVAGEDGEILKPKKKSKNKKVHFFSRFPKAVKMLSLLKNELSGRRVMIWYNMKAEEKIILDALTTAEISFLVARGGDKNLNANIDEFNRNPKFRVLVCQAKTINYGVTVLGLDYDDSMEDLPIDVTPEVYTQIFYSVNFSLEIRIQQEDRIHRIGQKFPCEYHTLYSNTSVEELVREALEEKKFLREFMMEDWIKTISEKERASLKGVK